MSTSSRTSARVRKTSRRCFLGKAALLAGGAAISGPLILTSRKAGAAGRVVIGTYGGSFADALNEAYFKPFTADTGIEVLVTSPAELGKLKAQVMTNTVEWDIVEPLTSEIQTAANDGLLEPIDYSVVKVPELIYPEAKQPYWLCLLIYSSGIGFDQKRNPAGKHPTTWTEFWDVKKFPGRRGLRSTANDTMELALLADGVDPKKLYPLDVDRAFKSLEKIKPHVQKWIDSSPQTTQLILQNELDFTNTYSGRVFSANNEGASLGFSLDQVIVHLDYFAVPKGAKNKAGAMQLLNSIISKPERQANFFKIISYGPVTKNGFDACDPKLRSTWLPDPKNPKHVVADEKWWGKDNHYEEVTKRLKAWLGT